MTGKYDTTEEKMSLQQYTPDWYDGSFDAKAGGEWVKYADVQGVLAFIGGYLLEHRKMLQAQGVHPKILAAVLHLETEIAKL